MNRLKFSFALTVVLLLIQIYLYKKIVKAIGSAPSRRWLRWVILGLFFIFNLAQVLGFIYQARFQDLPAWVTNVGIYFLFLWQFTSFVLFLAWLGGKAIMLPLRAGIWLLKRSHRNGDRLRHFMEGPSFVAFDRRRRAFLQRGSVVIAGAVLGGTIYSTIHRNDYEITAAEMPIAGLPTEFQGFTIALISDIHSSVFMPKEEMEMYVDLVNAMQADMIAVPGDFVNSMLDEVYPFAEAFSRLRAPQGIFGVLGNHDYYTDQVERVAAEVNKTGIRLLRNEQLFIERNGQKLMLLGVDDIKTYKLAPELLDRVIAQTDVGIPRILLCHRPYFFKHIAQRNVDLTLAGHTHGGQLIIRRVGDEVLSPARIASPYVAGHYSIGRSHMYVSRGVGTIGVPVRINCPPEVTKITLVRA